MQDDLQDFFKQDNDTEETSTAGKLALATLHLVFFAFAIYSAYHGIHATATYRAANGLGNAAGITGIVVIEIVMLGLYAAYFARRITGEAQQIAAAVTFGLGFILSCLGIIGDSQLQAGMTLSPWLASYIAWGLPIAPALMALGAAVVLATDPQLMRLMKQALSTQRYQERRHNSLMKAQDAQRKTAEDLANIQLNAQQQAARFLASAYRTPEAQEYIQRSALANLPDLLRAVGIDLPYGTVINGQVIEPPAVAAEPEPAAAEPGPATARPSVIDRVRSRMGNITYTQSDTPASVPGQGELPAGVGPTVSNPAPVYSNGQEAGADRPNG